MCGAVPGRPYTFLYGTIDTRSELAGGFTRTTSQERITGEETVVICDRCIQERQHRGVVRGSIAAVVALGIIVAGVVLALSGPLAGDVDLQPQQLLGFFVAIAGFMGVLLAIVWVAAHRRPVSDETGEEVAAELRRKDLEKRGFGLTYSHAQWRRHVESAGG
jgi:hypothetical protein